MKFILGALAGLTLLVGVTASQPADAACYMTPYGLHCWHPRYYGYGYGGGWYGHHRYWARPYYGY